MTRSEVSGASTNQEVNRRREMRELDGGHGNGNVDSGGKVTELEGSSAEAKTGRD